ncbi:putative transposase [Rhodococcus opacus B4]|uniref:Putative transposase n=1 Tax=Rhodococcus opacus (strain B4) TaxID=632772 RepID=C1ASI2_RHOOB|nr:putative transposase [Rhodococcus opacus B4]
MKRSDRDIMEILEAYDTTGTAHSAASLAGVDPKTVRHYVTVRRRHAGDRPVAATPHHRRSSTPDRAMG